MFVTVEDKAAGTITIPGNPIKMESIEESATRPPAPALGEHTESILKSLLGLDDDAIARLRGSGAI
jgi:crotonobetainyl-CoA:carnitine CoA-transferase CaiB-like acyl-CoA transferase